MTVYAFLKQAAQSHSAVVGGGKTEDIRCDLAAHSIEDSISSYMEENTDYCFEEMIRDLLEATGVEYWIISPMRTYRI